MLDMEQSFSIRLGVYALTLFVFLSAWGWGEGLKRVMRIKYDVAALSCLSGFAVFFFLGGVLALVGQANAVGLILVVLGGIVFSAVFGLSYIRCCKSISSTWEPLALLITLAVVVFYVFETQFPSLVFNFHDDFEKYFTYPKRLLQTGTLDPGPLNALGTETLGALAVLQGFILIFFSYPYVNGADAGWGFLLSAMLVISFFELKGRDAIVALVIIVSMFAVDMFYANISALWLAVAFMLGVLRVQEASICGRCKFALIGIFYAALISLKPTFILFVAAHFTAYVLASGIMKQYRRQLRSDLFWIFSGGAVVLAPWVLLQTENIAYLVSGGKSAFATQKLAVDVAPVPWSLFIDASWLPYTMLLIVCLGIAVGTSIVLSNKEKNNRENLFGMLLVLIVGGFYVIFIRYAGYFNGAFTHLRYFAPILVALLPYICASCYRRLDNALPGPQRQWGPLLVPAVALLAVVVLFGARFLDMQRQLIERGRLHYFGATTNSDSYYQYNQSVVWGSEIARTVQSIQELVPAGESILVWNNANFLLDFGRNRILDMDPAGINSPWARIPEVKYFLWERQGFGVRGAAGWNSRYRMGALREKMITIKSISMLQLFEKLASEGTILYDDGSFMLIAIENSEKVPSS